MSHALARASDIDIDTVRKTVNKGVAVGCIVVGAPLAILGVAMFVESYTSKSGDAHIGRVIGPGAFLIGAVLTALGVAGVRR